MKLQYYMILCVTCFLNWAVTTFRTMQTIYRKIPKTYRRSSLANSLSGIFTKFRRSHDSLHTLHAATGLDSEKLLFSTRTNNKEAPVSMDDVKAQYLRDVQNWHSEKQGSYFVAGFMEFDPKHAATKAYRLKNNSKKRTPPTNKPWFTF